MGLGRERGTGKKLPSGARGPRLKAGLPRAASHLSCPGLLRALAPRSVRPGHAAGSSESRGWRGSLALNCKTEGGKERRTNSPQRLLRPRSGAAVPATARLSEPGRTELGARTGLIGSNCGAYVDDDFFFFLNHSSPQFSGLIYSRYW